VLALLGQAEPASAAPKGDGSARPREGAGRDGPADADAAPATGETPVPQRATSRQAAVSA